MNTAPQNLELQFARLTFNRKLVLVTHLVLACCLGLTYFSHLKLSGFPYWMRPSALKLIGLAAPPLIPLIVSGVYAWRLVTFRRFPAYLYLALVIVIAVLTGLLYMGMFDIEVHAGTVIFTILMSTVLYVGAAKLLLKLPWD